MILIFPIKQKGQTNSNDNKNELIRENKKKKRWHNTIATIMVWKERKGIIHTSKNMETSLKNIKALTYSK